MLKGPILREIFMPPAIFALSLAAFCIGTTEFIISGILFGVSRDLAVSIPVAGLLVTGYAACVAIGGPIVGTLMSRVPVKTTILGSMAIFSVGQVACALASTYELLLLARLISALGHGVFFGVGSVAVTQLVPRERHGAALSLMVGGVTVATVLGLPIGTAIGTAFGWRVSFAAIAVVAALAFVAIALTLPGRSKDDDQTEAPLALQVKQLAHQEVWLSYLIIVAIMVGQVAFGTFQVALLTEVTRIDPAVMVPIYLFFGGAGSVLGIWLGGRAADRSGAAALPVALVGQIVCFLLFAVVMPNPIAAGVCLFLLGGFGVGFSTPVQVRIMHGARAAPRLAATLISMAYNIGISSGAAVGAALLSANVGYQALPLTGALFSAIALPLALLSIHLSRRGVS
jgi:DHA1 family inner membrane transport protein